MTPEQRAMYRSQIPFEEVRAKAEAIRSPYRVVGILGGMGPAATVDLFRETVEASAEKIIVAKNLQNITDQDHIEIYIANTPQVPDRTPFVLYDMGLEHDPAEDPFPYLVRGVNKLAKLDVKEFGIPCNTAHYFVPELQRYINDMGYDMKIINMIEETAGEVAKYFNKGAKVGVLATTGTLRSELYHAALSARGFEVLTPTIEHQDDWVMKAIYGKDTGIKATKDLSYAIPRKQLTDAANELHENGADVVLTACTEIPLALKQSDVSVKLINPTNVLGNRIIERAIAA